MRLPKTVQISGKTYKVSTAPKKWGGKGFTGPQTIIVGTKKNQSAQRIFENFVHESCEVIACERNVRFDASDNEMMFVMTHKQFDSFVADISAALWPMVEKRK